MQCKNCGNEIASNTKFCKYCGCSMQSVEEVQKQIYTKEKTKDIHKKLALLLLFVICLLGSVIYWKYTENAYKQLFKALENKNIEELNAVFPIKYLNEDGKTNIENSIEDFAKSRCSINIFKVSEKRELLGDDKLEIISRLETILERETYEIGQVYEAYVDFNYNGKVMFSPFVIIEIKGEYYLEPFRFLDWISEIHQLMSFQAN